MDIAKLQAIAGKLKDEKSAANGGNSEWPNTVFLPEGNHKGRFIFDPNEDVYEKYSHYGYFASGIRAPEMLDDSELPEGFDKEDHPLRVVAETLSQDYLKFGKGRKFSFITYFYLISTDAANEDWKPNTLYCIIGNGKFADAFTDMMTSLASDSPEQLLKSLSPDHEGPIMTITFKRGAQGKCSISPTFNNHPPIVKREDDDTDESYKEKIGALGYKPLAISYIKPGYDQGKYDALLEKLKKELDEIIEKNGDNPTPAEQELEDKKKEEQENSESDKESEKVEENTNSESKVSKDVEKKEEPSKETEAEKEPEKVEDKAPEPNQQSTTNDPFAAFRNKSV